MKKLITVLLAAMFLIAGSAYGDSCYETSILSPSPFMGNNDEIFKTGDGGIWQVKYAYEYLYEYYPTVLICGESKLVIKGKTIDIVKVGHGGSGGESRKRYVGKAPTYRGRRHSSSGCESGHWVDSVSNNGQIVKLEDGSIWEVDAVDAIDSSLWLPITDIVACDDKLTNTEDNETVSATRIR